MRRPLALPSLVAASLLAALAVAVTGSILIERFRALTSAAAAERQALLLSAQGLALDQELAHLRAEMLRLSRLVDVDGGDVEPQRRVLRIARRDVALFTSSIAILDERGGVVVSEPSGFTPRAGAALVARAHLPAGRRISVEGGEIAAAAPIAGRGAIVGIVGGDAADLFGPAVVAALRGGRAEIATKDGPPLVAIGAGVPGELARQGASGQSWLEDGKGRRWLVTEARLHSAPLVLRLAQPAESLLAEAAAPLRGLVAILVGGVVLVLAGGGGLALSLARVARTEAEVRRSRELAAVGRTAAAIAHEVKNSLNGLSMAIDLLAIGRAGPGAKRSVHERARAEIGRLKGVAEDLTLFAAPPRLLLGDVDLGDLCRRATASCADLAEEVGASVEMALPPGPLPMRADGDKLLSALRNLVRNGLEAMGPGAWGEPLGQPAAARPRRLGLTLEEEGGTAVVAVTDTGPGLPAEVRARLFEPFVTTKRTGTGLGLAIAHRVAAAHGGRIEAAERAGGGCTFRIFLPVPAPAGGRAAAGAA